ncbi:non-homologous end-joining DNA ligase [Saccharomonospora xinjiangensis]|uniref:non-homologous end-joining DNA ligase n=1 Tax=Saccharomonospora xinjiangensis TaxID=75294 RepID=UPI0010700439|nr:non-homologous end-joining DNA ligase [Saccharomonospora xinjiangensis]QBQ62218.1 Putative DNA ligase-like protein [Saccharomonospora xinjiangensis]
MASRLDPYRAKRRKGRTPEPLPDDVEPGEGAGEQFVIHEHHARRLHWDVRLERDGVLVSFAVPKGLPEQPGTVRLAVHTEDHPLEYATFSGEIPSGEYGAGRMTIWDRGRYETLKWSDHEVSVVLHGERVHGRYVFFRSRGGGEDGSDWNVIRSDPPDDPEWTPLPEKLRPMLAVAGTLPDPEHDTEYAYEFKWDGVRALARVEGGRATFHSRRGDDISAAYPELRPLGEHLGGTKVWLDGEIVAMRDGRPSFAALQNRIHAGEQHARRLSRQHPVTYLVFDLLHLDGRSCLGLPYRLRRRLLERLDISGEHWQVPPSFTGGGDAVVEAAAEQGLEGVIAKRLDAPYRPGERSRSWVKITDLLTSEVVIGGWRPGEGRRSGTFGSLMLGIPDGEGLRYVGQVGTGFDDATLRSLAARLRRLERRRTPFTTPLPKNRAAGAHWVSPKLVGEVAFKAWTDEGRLRAPTWRGLRPDRDPEETAR